MADNKKQNGMSRFWDVFDHYKRLLIAAGGASFLPFIAKFAKASPPITGLASITSLLLVLTAVLVFQFYEQSSRKKINLRLKLFFSFSIMSLLSYFILFTRFIYQYKSGSVILGCGWIPKAVRFASDSGIPTNAQCPGQYIELLNEFGGSIAKVFLTQNHSYVEMALIITWLCWFISVGVIIALFVTFQQNRKFKN